MMVLTKKNYINLKKGKFDSTTRNDLAEIFTSYRQDESIPLVVHFHGGLVNEQCGMEGAEKLLDVYQSARAYPVFFVWESGLIDVITHNLQEIAQEPFFQNLLKKVFEFAYSKLKEKGGSRGEHLDISEQATFQFQVLTTQPGAKDLTAESFGLKPYQDELRLTMPQRQQFQDLIESDETFKQSIQAIAAGVSDTNPRVLERGMPPGTPAKTKMSPEVLLELKKESSTGNVRGSISIAFMTRKALAVVTNVIFRFAKGRDHGLYATCVEEILRAFYIAAVGKEIWSLMKQDTLDAFGDDTNVYGGTAFIDELKKQYSADKLPRVILVGHSTGAVYISHFLRYADKVLPPKFQFDVVFLAGAVTFKLFSDTLNACGHRIREFRNFGMSDAVETKDILVHELPFLYPHSLLYFVSGVVEEEIDSPLVGMQRYYTAKGSYARDDIDTVLRFLEERRLTPTWAITASGALTGARCSAHSHGGFCEDAETIRSLMYFVAP